ncbi:MAG: phosphate starvation-inducible protein PsiF [Proteobacteria bacterium]|nr:phosphate starvation-inducible protein PsiF [Pseudomonadota bacterium]
MKTLAMILAAASLGLSGTAMAQTAAPASAPAKSAPAAKKSYAPRGPAKPRTAASIECSKQADTKGLHGKAREEFRNKCKKAAGK